MQLDESKLEGGMENLKPSRIPAQELQTALGIEGRSRGDTPSMRSHLDFAIL